MRSPRELRSEWTATALMLAAVTACTFFLHAHSVDVDEATAVRRQQLDQFAAVADDTPRHSDLRAFDGLFGAYALSREHTEWGGFLTLRPQAEAVR